VGIAEEHLLGKVFIHKGRIGFWLFDLLILIRCEFLRQRRAAQQDDEGCGESEQITDSAVQFR